MKRIILSSNSIPFGPECPFKRESNTSYCDNFLNSKDLAYMEKAKNRTGSIVMMSPDEYYNECATSVFNTTPESLKDQRRADGLVEQYIQDMRNGDKFPLPHINYPDHGQEGLHRMMAAGDIYGWDTKFPVLVITEVDPHIEELNSIWRYWCDAVYKAKQFKYSADSWKHDIVEEIQYKLDEYTDNQYKVIAVSESDDNVEVIIKQFADIMSPTTIFEPEFRDDSDEFDIDSLNLDDLDWDGADIDDLLDKLNRRN